MTLTMEAAARLCGLPKLPAPLITREPCESCADATTEADTGEFVCAASPSGDRECEAYFTVRQMEDIAVQVAALYKTMGDKQMRESMSTGTGASYDEAVWVQAMGAEFNSEAFMDLCGCKEGAV